MKQELPFAIVLLAAGSLLWFWQPKLGDSGTSVIENTSLTQEKAALDDGEPSQRLSDSQNEVSNIGSMSAITDQRQNQQAWFGSSELQKPNLKPKETIITASFQDLIRNKQTFAPNVSKEVVSYVHLKSNEKTVEFLADVAKQLANSPKFGTSLLLTGNLFGQTVSANGRYFQMGQGSGKSRIDLQFGDSENSPTVFQLCDGRFVYNLQTSGPKSAPTFEFVDLMRVRESSGEQTQQISPTGWVATGGISSLFQHLASAFNFGELESDGGDQILLRGSWDEDALRRIVTTGNEIDLGTPVHWEKVPAQLPHAVEIVLQNYDEFGYFPTRISFQKFSAVDQNKETKIVLQPTVTLRLDAPKSLPEINDRFFVIDSSNLESVDATDNYIERINLFRAIPFRRPEFNTQKAEGPGAKVR